MRDTTRAERLLSLFTSPDCAAAIAGDLTEERRHRGSIWFWLHVLGTMLALWRSALADAPLMVLVLAVTGCSLLAGPALGGVAAVNLFPHWSGSPVSWIALSFFWWGGALWTGASLVSIAPRRGMAACATLAVAGEALLIAFGVKRALARPAERRVRPLLHDRPGHTSASADRRCDRSPPDDRLGHPHYGIAALNPLVLTSTRRARLRRSFPALELPAAVVSWFHAEPCATAFAPISAARVFLTLGALLPYWRLLTLRRHLRHRRLLRI